MLRTLYQSREFRRWALMGYWFAMFTATHWPDVGRYIPELGPFDFADVVVHAMIYAGWVGMWWWFLSAADRRTTRAVIGWLVLGGTLWAGFDEVSQALVARSPELADFLGDIVGVLLAVTVLSLWRPLWRDPRLPRRPLV